MLCFVSNFDNFVDCSLFYIHCCWLLLYEINGILNYIILYFHTHRKLNASSLVLFQLQSNCQDKLIRIQLLNSRLSWANWTQDHIVTWVTKLMTKLGYTKKIYYLCKVSKQATISFPLHNFVCFIAKNV